MRVFCLLAALTLLSAPCIAGEQAATPTAEANELIGYWKDIDGMALNADGSVNWLGSKVPGTWSAKNQRLELVQKGHSTFWTYAIRRQLHKGMRVKGKAAQMGVYLDLKSPTASKSYKKIDGEKWKEAVRSIGVPVEDLERSLLGFWVENDGGMELRKDGTICWMGKHAQGTWSVKGRHFETSDGEDTWVSTCTITGRAGQIYSGRTDEHTETLWLTKDDTDAIGKYYRTDEAGWKNHVGELAGHRTIAPAEAQVAKPAKKERHVKKKDAGEFKPAAVVGRWIGAGNGASGSMVLNADGTGQLDDGDSVSALRWKVKGKKLCFDHEGRWNCDEFSITDQELNMFNEDDGARYLRDTSGNKK